MINHLFSEQTYQIRKKILSIVGAEFKVFNAKQEIIMFSKMKAFKLKEDIRIYSSEDMQNEILSIRARSIIDFSSTYDVVDTKTGEKIGALKRKGMKSILKDKWIIMDKDDAETGQIQEDSMALALLRRFLTNLIPQSYKVEVSGQKVCEFKQNFNPFVVKLNLDFTLDTNNSLDRRLGIAAGILLCAIEGKQG